MSRYDGLIIPRSYSEYINKTDAATLLQALQLSGVMDNAPTADSNNPVKSGGIRTALDNLVKTINIDVKLPNTTTTGAVGNRFYQMIESLSTYGLTMNRVIGIVVTNIANSQQYMLYGFIYNGSIYVNCYSQSANQTVTSVLGSIKLLYI